MNTTDIEKMSTIERLQTMEALWDALLHDSEAIRSPNWHGDVLAERKKSMEYGDAEFYTIDELKTRRR